MQSVGLEITSCEHPVTLIETISHSDYSYGLCPIIHQDSEKLLQDISRNSTLHNTLNVSDLILADAATARALFCVVSPWIDLDSPDNIIRTNSERLLKRQCEWVSHCGVKNALIQMPSHGLLANFSKCINDSIVYLGSTGVRFELLISFARLCYEYR